MVKDILKEAREREAFQWMGGHGQKEYPAWFAEAIEKGIVTFEIGRAEQVKLKILTIDGIKTADVGDYIIKLNLAYEKEIVERKLGKLYQHLESILSDLPDHTGRDHAGKMLVRESICFAKNLMTELYPCKPEIFKATYEEYKLDIPMSTVAETGGEAE